MSNQIPTEDLLFLKSNVGGINTIKENVGRSNNYQPTSKNIVPRDNTFIILAIIILFSFLWWRIYLKSVKTNKKILSEVDSRLVEQVTEIQDTMRQEKEEKKIDMRFPLTEHPVEQIEEQVNLNIDYDDKKKKKKKNNDQLSRDMIYQDIGPSPYNY